MTREITLPGRHGAVRGVALVDDEDYERVAPHRWYLSANGYARGMIEGRWVLLHRHVLGLGSLLPRQTWWRARVSVKGREISAGYFNTEEEAAAAAAAVRLQHMPFSQGDRTPLGLEPVR